MRKIIVISIAIIIPTIIGYLYYAHYTSEGAPWSVQCGFHSLTGLQCPGCGGQRAIHYLLHGELLKALRYNVLFVVGLPFLLYMYWLVVETHGLKKTRCLNSFFYSSFFAKMALVVIGSFFILRNIPIEPFIYLSPP